jgi:hypothetical protein
MVRRANMDDVGRQLLHHAGRIIVGIGMAEALAVESVRPQTATSSPPSARCRRGGNHAVEGVRSQRGIPHLGAASGAATADPGVRGGVIPSRSRSAPRWLWTQRISSWWLRAVARDRSGDRGYNRAGRARSDGYLHYRNQHPPERAAGEQMHVKVRHLLSAISAHIGKQPITR